MSLEPPQFNVPFAQGGNMTPQTYALLRGFYDALTEPKTSITMVSPDGSSWSITVSNAGALVVSPT